MIRAGIEIDRPPGDVFAYVEQLDRHGEWQSAIVSARKEPPGPTRVGTRNIEVRKVPGGPRDFVSEIFQYDPPRRIAARGISKGPIRPTIVITIEPLDGGTRSRYTLELTLEGRGIGKLFAIFARRAARRQVPIDEQRLKEVLEHEER